MFTTLKNAALVFAAELRQRRTPDATPDFVLTSRVNPTAMQAERQRRVNAASERSEAARVRARLEREEREATLREEDRRASDRHHHYEMARAAAAARARVSRAAVDALDALPALSAEDLLALDALEGGQ